MRITKVDDPNEELLHWMQVQSLVQEVYSNGPAASHCSTSSDREDTTSSSQSSNPERDWDAIVTDAFFRLAVDPATKERFLLRPGREKHDELLIDTLEALLHQQNESTAAAVQVTFGDRLQATSCADEDPQVRNGFRTVMYCSNTPT